MIPPIILKTQIYSLINADEDEIEVLSSPIAVEALYQGKERKLFIPTAHRFIGTAESILKDYTASLALALAVAERSSNFRVELDAETTEEIVERTRELKRMLKEQL